MTLLSKEDILAAQDIPFEEVEVPEWGGALFIYGLTGAERDRFEASVLRKQGDSYEAVMADMRAKLLAVSIRDGDGGRIFGDGDIMALSGKSAAVLDRLFAIASRLSGISPDDVDELAKNSGGVQSDGFGSD